MVQEDKSVFVAIIYKVSPGLNVHASAELESQDETVDANSVAAPDTIWNLILEAPLDIVDEVLFDGIRKNLKLPANGEPDGEYEFIYIAGAMNDGDNIAVALLVGLKSEGITIEATWTWPEP